MRHAPQSQSFQQSPLAEPELRPLTLLERSVKKPNLVSGNEEQRPHQPKMLEHEVHLVASTIAQAYFRFRSARQRTSLVQDLRIRQIHRFHAGKQRSVRKVSVVEIDKITRIYHSNAFEN